MTLFFSDKYHIKSVSRDMQRHGIDRIFTRKTNGDEFSVEYKADATASRTGNAFVETVSVDTQNKPGWAYYCKATFIIYYINSIGPIYVLRTSKLKQALPEWERKYRSVAVPNDGYKTIGLLVPLREFEEIAEAILDI